MSKKETRLENLFVVNNEFNKQLKSSEYKKNGQFPVVDQSLLFISGYSDRQELVRYDTPIIVFGDHTRSVKFINFPFIVGADGVQVLKPKPVVTPEYLYYLVQVIANKIGNGGYERHLKYLKPYLVTYDSNIKVQQKIAMVLATIDGQIEKSNSYNNSRTNYADLRQGMLHDLFTRGIDIKTGKIRKSPQDTPNLYKPSLLGLIPKDWQCIKLNELIESIIDNRGKTPPTINNNGIELIETTSISGVELYPDYLKVSKFITQSTYDNYFRSYLEKNDILISTVGEYAGSTAILNQKRGIIAQNLIGLRVLANNSPYYVYYWFKTIFFKTQAKQIIMNAVQHSLKVPNLLNLYIQQPNFHEQQMIDEKLTSIYNLISIEKEYLTKLKKIKDGLINNLLNGIN